MRRKLVAGNWKMHGLPSDAGAWIQKFRELSREQHFGAEVLICPPYLHIPLMYEGLKALNIKTGAQNCATQDKGAYTGEVSAQMLADAGVSYIILGHSERRQYYYETSQTLEPKIQMVWNAGCVPVFCVGETLDEREAGRAEDVVATQLHVLINACRNAPAAEVCIAYEPVWAIGTGKTATAGQAGDMHAFIRKTLSTTLGEEKAQSIRILYGGSVKPDNAAELFACSDIDGALVGGASLKPEDFIPIIAAAGV